jgi:hypothetical protein
MIPTIPGDEDSNEHRHSKELLLEASIGTERIYRARPTVVRLDIVRTFAQVETPPHATTTGFVYGVVVQQTLTVR